MKSQSLEVEEEMLETVEYWVNQLHTVDDVRSRTAELFDLCV